MTSADEDYAKTLELQRLAFEKQFGSLESLGYDDKTKTDTTKNDSNESNNDNEISETTKTSDDDINSSDDSIDSDHVTLTKSSSLPSKQPRVIKFNGPTDSYVPPSKHELKLLRSGKPLKLAQQPVSVPEESDEEETLEAENLKNDIELQRFLKESHLLGAFDSTGHDDDTITGKARSKTLEMRLKNLSSINGRAEKITKLEKVPINVRKGMIDKHMKKIAQHEQDAKDGGIVLSHIKKGQFRKIESTYKNDIERRIGSSIKKHQNARTKTRQRGLKIHSVGQSTRNGLVISKRDIARINGKK